MDAAGAGPGGARAALRRVRRGRPKAAPRRARRERATAAPRRVRRSRPIRRPAAATRTGPGRPLRGRTRSRHPRPARRPPADQPAQQPQQPGGQPGQPAKPDSPGRLEAKGPQARSKLRGVTASLPAEVQQVFDRFITTEYTTIDARGQPITWPVTPYYQPRRAVHRRHDRRSATRRRRYDARANPKVALLFSDPTGSGIETARRRCSSRASPTWTTATSRPTASATRARSVEKLPGTKELHAAEAAPAACSAGTSRASTSTCGRSASTSGRDGDATREPELFDAHMEEVRSGHDEEPDGAARRRPRAAARCGTGAWTSSASATRRRCCRSSRPTASRSRCACRSRWTAAARRVRIGGGAARRAGAAGPRLPRRARPRARVRVAAELPGARRPRGGGRRLGRSCRTSWSAASSCRRARSRALRDERPQDDALWRTARTTRRELGA